MTDADGVVQLKVRVEPDVHERLRAAAFEAHIHIADIVRDGIELALAAYTAGSTVTP